MCCCSYSSLEIANFGSVLGTSCFGQVVIHEITDCFGDFDHTFGLSDLVRPFDLLMDARNYTSVTCIHQACYQIYKLC